MAPLSHELVSLSGGQFRPVGYGQFQPVWGGQFKSVEGGQFHRILQLSSNTLILILPI
jgi:hypothetical protein